MSNRTTEKDLRALVERLNAELGLPAEPYTQGPDGCFTPNAGVYLLDYAYGGVRLNRMSRKPGCTGQEDLSPRGTKREVYAFIHAFLAGIEVGMDAQSRGLLGS